MFHFSWRSTTEREIDSLRHGENTALFKLEKQKTEVQTANAVMSSLQSELQDRDRKIEELKGQVETMNRDKNANSGTGDYILIFFHLFSFLVYFANMYNLYY